MYITGETLGSNLLYSTPFHYTDEQHTFDLVLYPVTMENILEFSVFKQSILVRKNSTFPVKKILKMSYLEFLFFAFNNFEFAAEYKMPLLPSYYVFAFNLLKLVFKNQTVEINMQAGRFRINDVEIDDDKFDDFRRIIILQNGIDFDIDEFIHYDTEQKLIEAQNAISDKDNSTIEDYIDSVCVALNRREQDVKDMPIRKFWRLVKRITKRDMFVAMKTGECSGMVKFKEPVQYWMSNIDEDDKFDNVKTDAQTLQQMIS